MINDGINNVPEKTITIFPERKELNKKNNRINNIIDKPSKKRDWFTPHFYRCLPLVIGNQYGFIIKSEFDFSFIWNGGDEKDAVTFSFNEELEDLNKKFPSIQSHFGSGIITINTPFILRTPPSVNLMTINPPNYIMPNITVLTGVIETDNIRRNFTFNLKIQIPNIEVVVPAGTPLAAFIPIPRYYADSFDLKFAEDIFDETTLIEEYQANSDTEIFRQEIEPNLPNGVGRQYFNGKDIYENKFSDHQKP
jgi:hypothetical protein